MSFDPFEPPDPEAEAIADEVFGELARRIGPTPEGLCLRTAAPSISFTGDNPPSRSAGRAAVMNLPATSTGGQSISPPRAPDTPPTVSGRNAITAGGRPLADWDADLDFIDLVRGLLGLQPVGVTAKCILPSFGEKRVSTIFLGRGGHYIYGSEGRGPRIDLPMARLYASIVAGTVIPELEPPELATWKLDLLRATGAVHAEAVPLPPLPPRSSVTDEKIHRRIGDLFTAKWIAEPGARSEIARRFLARFACISEDKARGGIERLEHAEVICCVHKEWRGKHLHKYWLPGDGA